MLHVQNYVVLRCTKRNKQLTQKKTLSLFVQIDWNKRF
jgi:hypothetical protein